MPLDLSEMTEDEKAAHIDAVEIMLDYGEVDSLSDEDMELYNQLIAECRQKSELKNEKDTLDNIIASAEQRRNEQNEINTEQIDRETR